MQKEFDYKAWANSELLTAIADIDTTSFPEDYRLAVRLLNHTYVADQIFKAHLRYEPHHYSWVNTDETPTLSELQADIKNNDVWYCDFVGSLNDESRSKTITFTFTDGQSGSMTVEEILSHLLIHGAYHRGQISNVLDRCGVQKPNDIFTRFLHEQEPERRQV